MFNTELDEMFLPITNTVTDMYMPIPIQIYKLSNSVAANLEQNATSVSSKEPSPPILVHLSLS